MQKKIYLDTSVFGGYFDQPFELDTQIFFNTLGQNNYVLMISDLLVSELSFAPQEVQNILNNIPNQLLIEVLVTKDAEDLADEYIIAKVVGKSSLNDCIHIATATINNADIIASWNFKHIVNLTRIQGYNGVNKIKGYKEIEIRTPKEILYYDI